MGYDYTTYIYYVDVGYHDSVLYPHALQTYIYSVHFIQTDSVGMDDVTKRLQDDVTIRHPGAPLAFNQFYLIRSYLIGLYCPHWIIQP